MRPTPLLRAIRERSLSLGGYCTVQSPELIELMGHCGFNHVLIDHMFTGIDWRTTADMVRAAHLFGVAPIVRVQTYSWGSRGQDFRVASEVARALGIGAAGAMVSIGSLDELDRCLGVQRDAHHRRIWIAPDVDAIEAGQHASDDQDERFFVLPLVEQPQLIDEVEEMVKLEGLSCIGVGIHDICGAVHQPFNVEHPDVWKLIDRLISAATPRGIDVWVNTGYRYKKVEDITARIGRMWDHGIRTMQVQGPEFLLYHMLNGIRAGAHDAVAQRSAP